MEVRLQRLKQFDKAESAYDEAVRIQDKLVRTIPAVPHYQRDLAWSYNGLGLVHARNKQYDKADPAFKKALAGWEKLLKDHGGERDYSAGQAMTCFYLGDLSRAGANPKDAVAWYNRALEVAPESMKSFIKKRLNSLESK